MTYDEAYKKFGKIYSYEQIVKIETCFQHDNTEEGIRYIMEQVGCDETIAAQLYNVVTKTSTKNIPQSPDSEPSVPKCPTCGSTDIKKISTISKVGSVAFWGIFSQKHKKQFKCQNPYCGYEW